MPTKAQNTVNKKDKSSQPAVRKSLFKKLFKFLTYFLLIIVVLLSAAAILVSTGLLNGLVLDIVTDKINSSWNLKESSLYAGSLEGNLFKGIKLNNGCITVKGDTLIKFSSIEVKYSLDRILFKDIQIEKVNLEDPQINLYKVKSRGDSLNWNFAHLFAAEGEEIDTSKKEFDWDVKVEELKIHNGNIRILDSNLTGTFVRAVKMPKLDKFDAGKLDIKNLELDMSAEYNEDYKIVNLKNLSFATNSDFTLKKLSFAARVEERDTLSEFRSFELLTGRTGITATIISMKGLDPFHGVAYEDFKNNEINVDLSTEKFDFDDLKFFFPDLAFLNNIVNLQLKANGKYGNMNVKNMVLRTPGSYYNFRGKIENLDEPSKLRFDLKGENLVIDPADTKNIVPGLNLPDYSYIGKVTGSLRYYGEPLDFKTEFDVSSQYGGANGTFDLNLNTPNYYYNTKVETASLNLGGILNNKDLESSLNMRAEVSGSGFEPENMSTKVIYEITDSKIYDQEISKSSGVVELHNNNIDADITYVSNELNTSAKGRVNLSNLADAEYTLKGTARGLDISRFTKNTDDRSNLNLAFDIEGKGLSIENITGKYSFDLDDSYFATYRIPASPVNITINSLGSNGSVNVSSNFFDFNAKGDFNLKEIADVIGYNMGLIAGEINKKFNPDTIGTMASQNTNTRSSANLDFEYSFTAKNITPVYAMLDTSGLIFKGVISGRMKNSSLGFLSFTNIAVDDFRFNDTAIIVKNLKGSVEFGNDYTKVSPFGESMIYPLSSNMSLTCDKAVMGTFYADKVNFKYVLADANQKFSVAAGQDTLTNFRLMGSSDLDKDSIRIIINEIFLRHRKFEMKNDGEIVLKYDSDPSKRTFTFEKFNVKNDILKFSASGDLSLGGNSDLNLELKNVKLKELIQLFSPQDTASRYYAQKKSPLRGEIRRLSFGFKGNLDEPVLNIEMNTGLLRYENNKIGRIDAFIDYANSLLSTEVLISNAMGNGRLRLTGDVPLVNPLAKENESGISGIENTSVNLRLKANNFQVNFFSKLIPNFADIRGLLDGEIDAAGTAANPLLTGGMTITKGRFYFGLTGMYHRFNSVLKTQNSDLVVEQFSIFNVNDYRRHLDLWGRINFEGLKINNIDLSTSGDVVVLDRTSDGTALGFYGDMIAGVGTPPITIKGNLKNLFVEGQLEIKSAKLTFPQLPGASYDVSSDNFVYRVITDTLGTEFRDTTIIVAPDEIGKIDPFMRAYVVSEEEERPSSINIIYDINVKTLKNAYVNISFNKVTQEELFGEIKADLNISNTSTNQMQVFGALEIVGDSYYRFYRNFNVRESKITFNGTADDPALNIHAVYASKTTQSFSSNGNGEGVEIVLDITGTAKKPVLTLKLYENGVEMTGKDAQSDAISYLLFGVSKTELSSGQKNALARNFGTTTGSTYLSGLLSNVIRDVAPFIINTEIIYSEGNVATGTDIRITSEVGDAIVKLGGKVFSGINNTEVSIQYPLNKILKMNLSNNLLLEIAREVDDNSLSGARSVLTGVRLIYKIRY